MTLLMKRDQAVNGPMVGPVHAGVRLGWPAWLAVVCVAFVVNHAAAQYGGAEDPRVRTAVPKPAGGSPQWVCPESTVTIDPVWRGQQIECSFSIRNEGAGDLNIKARGG